MADIGKDFGLSQQLGEKGSDFANRIKEAKEGNSVADNLGRSKKVEKPGQDGQKDAAKPDKQGSQKSTLETLVEKIHILVEKIEPKLPVAALTA
jgi:hypothetical protein